ncbi:TetR/AcrR family transcriptional regulator [Leucobacter triazinivorans]|uniref:TetR/AcrR family transcriptional regulator n=1 Tax=Leucobacter triazinivorans TaxID=1784719 RepID=A0A4V0Z1V3_9MICO|nr:helix-turn-helix domain-containing protein [Leucobacter triazinivorans]QBE49709.1 TetR/AcrR family transcriptional regulator [Leucobacter triazinivorans]
MANDARDRILEACERVIARAGLRGFRMGDVAREAGVSIGLLPYHFGDRDGLLQAALDHVNESAARRAAALPAADAGSTAAGAGSAAHSTTPAPLAGERLAALLCSEFGDDPQVRAGSTAWNELRAAAVFDADRAAAVARSTADWQRAVRDLVREATRDGEPHTTAAADPDAAALILTALVEGLSGRWLTGQIAAVEAQEAVRTALRAQGLLVDIV